MNGLSMKTKQHLLQICLLCAALLPAAVQAQFNFSTNNGVLTITGYNGSFGSGNVVIPSAANGYPVTSIGDYAFRATYLTSITIPNSVTNIGSSAFDACTSLTNVTIGNSVTNIGSSAFDGCSKLASVTIPGSVTNIGNSAFSVCANLVAITVNASNSFYSSTNGVLFNKTKTTLVQYPNGLGGSYPIPKSVTSIGVGAFGYSYSLTNVTFPNSVTNIGNDAFAECISLNTVIISTNVTNIGADAFHDCHSLTSITIPNRVTSIGSQAFCFCINLASVTIGTNVTSIHFDVFLACPSLTGIYFLGNAPGVLFSALDSADNIATVYYLPGTTGWGTPGTPFGGCPTALWLPQAQTGAASFGVQTNQFGFNITWASDMVVVVEACADLANPVWTPVGTNTLTGGSSYFSDSQWMNYPGRYYRLRSP